MPGITPIPATRVSDQLIRSRLLTQLQFDQQDMFRIQTQLSTGRRILLPSQDAPAAARAISLQRLIERKTQVSVNLTTNQTYLAATDSALSSVSGMLAEIRGSSLAVVGTTATSTQRNAVAQEVDRVIQQLINTGNQTFRGRYLFAGSKISQAPFAMVDGFVQYTGNETGLQSYSDLDTLFESSLNGNAVFGAISPEVRGTADLNPVLTAGTRLSDLRGGLGISRGSLSLSDGTNSRIVDISHAETIGDVARILESQPPVGRTIRATVTPTGLKIELDEAGGGALTIREVGGGTTAKQLGILKESGASTGIVVGQDLNPGLQKTTQLSDILGAKSLARVASVGSNNDLILQATTAGAAFNGVTFQVIDDELLAASLGLTAGNEIAEFDAAPRAAFGALSFSGSDNDLTLTANTTGTDYNNVTFRIVSQAGPAGLTNGAGAAFDANTKTLTLTLDSTNNTIATADIQAAINSNTPFTATLDTSVEVANSGLGTVDGGTALTGVVGGTSNSGGAAKTLYVRVQVGQSTTTLVADAINFQVSEFRAQLDVADATSSVLMGNGVIDLNASGATFGGSGTVFDKDSGVRIVNSGKTFDISFASANNVEDLLNILNGAGAGLVASINADGSGINVRSNLSGADFSIGELGGTTATELGIRSFSANTPLNSLNGGLGVQSAEGTDFTIVRNDGVELSIDISSAITVGDVLNLINNNATNLNVPSLNSPNRVVARLAEFGNGIELVDDNPAGVDAEGLPRTLQVRTNIRSLAAVDLGLVPEGSSVSAPVTPAVQAGGNANLTNSNADIAFAAVQGGTQLNGAQVQFVSVAAVGNQALASYDAGSNVLTIDVEFGTTTAQTVIDAVNGTLGGLVNATLNTDEGPNTGLGTIDPADAGTVATLGGGTPEVLTGQDVNKLEVQGVFNSLLRLRTALAEDDTIQISRALELLDADLLRVNFARAEIGARQQGLDVLQGRLDSEKIELRAALSVEIETDFTEAISNLTARQFAYEASLRTTASIMQMSLLNYL